MRREFFTAQIQRLCLRFDKKNFDPEFCKLVWIEVCGMDERRFERAVDVWIGSRTPSRPPLLAEFREARLAGDTKNFQAEVRGAISSLEARAPKAMQDHLRQVLGSEYGGVSGTREAFEVAKLRLMTGKK